MDYMADSLELSNLREDYRLAALDEQNCDASPMRQFANWFQDAKRAGLKEPNALTLATVSRDGQPSARIVLLKALEDEHFVFYTNYESRKGRELAENPRCALTFFWAEDLLGDQGKQVEEKYGASKVEAVLPKLRTFSLQGARSGHAVSGAEVERA